ncbi:hypothetical protein JW992_15345 [candidate division KSB1 bacterium]|nr:hypothetical protein [candidate division KSB1 bacterium]
MNRNLAVPALILALAAVVIAIFALSVAHNARQTALSEIELEEHNALVTPVFDQETGSWSYLAIYEWTISHSSGPAVRLESLAPANAGEGYAVSLLEGEPVGQDLQDRIFRTELTLAEIRRDPQTVKALGQTLLAEREFLGWVLQDGKSRSLRLGIRLSPYDETQSRLADVVLLSFKLSFDNGKTQLIRRAVPIQALTGLNR